MLEAPNEIFIRGKGTESQGGYRVQRIPQYGRLGR